LVLCLLQSVLCLLHAARSTEGRCADKGCEKGLDAEAACLEAACVVGMPFVMTVVCKEVIAMEAMQAPLLKEEAWCGCSHKAAGALARTDSHIPFAAPSPPFSLHPHPPQGRALALRHGLCGVSRRMQQLQCLCPPPGSVCLSSSCVAGWGSRAVCACACALLCVLVSVLVCGLERVVV